MQKYQYSCDYCHHFIETGGPWPYRRENQKLHRYESYADVSMGPIHGLVALIYCPTCDRRKEYRIVEYEKPLKDVSDIWLSSVPRKTKMVCHKCKNPVFFTLPPDSVRCPRCKKGTFELFEPLEEDFGKCPVPPPQSPLKVRQKGKAIHIPKPTAVIDSAEHMGYKFDALVKSLKTVTPAEAGVQNSLNLLDSRFRGNDKNGEIATFYESIKFERFSNWFTGTIHKRLPIGDYTILGMEDEVVVERKTLPDLVKSIIQERKDFIQKCEDISTFKKKCIVIEGSMASLKTPYEDSQSHPNAVFGSLLAAQERWNIPIYFLDNFLLAEEFVASMLSKYHAYQWLERNGFQRCLIEGDI